MIPKDWEVRNKMREQATNKANNTNIKKELANRLKQIMNENNISGRGLSRVSGVPEISVRRVLSGSGNPTINTIHKICIALNMSVSKFLDGLGYVEDSDR